VRWRKENITSVAIDFLLKYPKKILFVDQCALNAVLYGRWKPLHEKYNLLFSYVPDGMSAKSMKLFLRDKVVIHFTLQRPWQMLCRNRLSFLYFKYLKLSPAGGEVKKYEDFELSKLPMFIKIRLLNFYHDIPFLQSAWQKFKQSI
jgi:lipopolysaccharide biosynthesis glycosyltransferase